MRRLLPLMLALLALSSFAACGDSSDDAENSADTPSAGGSPQPGEEPSPPAEEEPADEDAKNLSVIDGQGETDLRAVEERSHALDALEDKCPGEARSRLADYATVAKQEAEKEGAELSTLQALRGVTKSIPRSLIGKVKCQDQFVAYIALVASGASP
jgi:hypothetical protein